MRQLSVLLAATVAVTGCGLGAAVAGSAGQRPPGDTIVSVTGNAANGFEIRHYDGSEEFPPTLSEARAECTEYDTQVARTRCWVGVRTWYRDLGDLRQALAWAHRSAHRR
jgi:hypothetical protein